MACSLLVGARAMNDSASTQSESGSEPSLVDSVIRVVEAGQRLLLDRLDLARFDLSRLVNRTMRGVAFIAGGAVLLIGACFALLGGAVMWLHQSLYLSLAASCVIVAAVAGGVGGGVIFAGVRRTRPETGDLGTAGALIEPLHGPPRVAGNGGQQT